MSDIVTDVATEGTLSSETADRFSEAWRRCSEMAFERRMALALELSKCHDLTHLAVAYNS